MCEFGFEPHPTGCLLFEQPRGKLKGAPGVHSFLHGATLSQTSTDFDLGAALSL